MKVTRNMVRGIHATLWLVAFAVVALLVSVAQYLLILAGNPDLWLAIVPVAAFHAAVAVYAIITIRDWRATLARARAQGLLG